MRSVRQISKIYTYNRDHDDQICAKYLKCCKQSQNYMYNVLNNTYTPRVPLSSGKLVSCKWKEEGDTEGRGCVVRLSLLHLPWRRPDDFDILLPHKRQQRAGRDTARRGGNEGQKEGTFMGWGNDSLGQRQWRLPDRLSWLFPRGIC